MTDSDDKQYHSLIFGKGIYRQVDQVQDPFERSGVSTCPLLVNEITDEQFYMKKYPRGRRSLQHYESLILSQPLSHNFLWPVDMIRCMDQASYDTNGDIEVLFPYDEYPYLINGRDRFHSITDWSWKNKEIQTIAVNIVACLYELNQSGYLYGGLHLCKIFFTEDNYPIFDFSNSIFSNKEIREGDCDILLSDYTEESNCPIIDFAEPALMQGKIKKFDIETQNYSLCALLFYILFGRYAYDGRLLTGASDDTIKKHYAKFMRYHQLPIFIFDPENKENSLGTFDDELELVKNWEDCPKQLKSVFIKTLERESAERNKKVENPTPSDWLGYFYELGWVRNKEGKEYD